MEPASPALHEEPASPPSWPEPFATWAALARPRRAIPILLVAGPLIYGQSVWNKAPLPGALSGLSLALGAALVAPALWRVLSRWWWGPILYVATALGLTWLTAIALPQLGGFDDPFFAQPAALAILAAGTLVAGFLLGRDIEIEQRLARERERLSALTRARDDAELLALRAQLDPHFLFNTLNAIAEWCSLDPEVAERAILDLSNVMRTIQQGARRTSWPLREELALSEAVLSLHAARDPERFTSTIEGEPSDLPVPPLILLPLIENAVKHGPAAGHPGPITVRVQPEGPGARIEISNPGPFAGRREGGQGLDLVEKRLALLESASARLEIGEESGRTTATLHLPGPS